MKKPDIFEYTDYRSYLKSFAADKKKDTPRWSLGVWAKQLELNGTASLTMVLNGQRSPGPRIVYQLVQYFKFNKSEKRFFEGLIELDKSSDKIEKKIEILNSLRQIVPERDLSFDTVDQFSAVSDWQNYAIRQLTQVMNFQSKIAWIKSALRFALTENEIKKSIELMLKIGWLKTDQNKQFVKSDTDLEVEPQVASEAVKRYHTNVIELAIQSLRSEPIENREFSALTLALDKADLLAAREIIADCKRKIRRLAGGKKPNSVYQLNVQFFPLAIVDEASSKLKGDKV